MMLSQIYFKLDSIYIVELTDSIIIFYMGKRSKNKKNNNFNNKKLFRQKLVCLWSLKYHSCIFLLLFSFLIFDPEIYLEILGTTTEKHNSVIFMRFLVKTENITLAKREKFLVINNVINFQAFIKIWRC